MTKCCPQYTFCITIKLIKTPGWQPRKKIVNLSNNRPFGRLCSHRTLLVQCMF
jgi:hypothetical protein